MVLLSCRVRRACEHRQLHLGHQRVVNGGVCQPGAIRRPPVSHVGVEDLLWGVRAQRLPVSSSGLLQAEKEPKMLSGISGTLCLGFLVTSGFFLNRPAETFVGHLKENKPLVSDQTLQSAPLGIYQQHDPSLLNLKHTLPAAQLINHLRL